jgi:PhzF family phenazine biosynthesis protein
MPPVIACVDAFTDRPFKGNQAAVCLLDDRRSAAWMQQLAAEMNLAETAFVYQSGDGLHLRWFSPTTEVALCGHATLAAAHVLWKEQRYPQREPIRFHTRSGVLTATTAGDLIELDFPAEPATAVRPPRGLLEALGVKKPIWFGRNRMDYLVEVPSQSDVRNLQPNLAALSKFETRGVIVTARFRGRGYHFISRFFAPAAGIPEDPVTGSAHCCLAPYWGAKLNKDSMVGYQASARSGIVRVALAGKRVKLRGHAVLIYRGRLEL